VSAISLLAAILSNLMHEGLGHAATELLTGTKSGLLTTVAWSSGFDSRLVAAGGTLANLAASIVFWIALRNAKSASVRWRFFLLTSFEAEPIRRSYLVLLYFLLPLHPHASAARL
jgi:hypothetical protein